MLTLKVFISSGARLNDASLRLLDHWSFSQMEHKYGEFSRFRESDKQLKHELGSV